MLRAWASVEGELRGFLRHQMRDDDLAADLLHDVFIKAMLQGGNFCAVDNARAWLFRIARNALIDQQRSTRPQDPVPEDLPAAEPDVAPVDTLADCLPRALAALSAEDRDAVEQCDLRGLNQADYAALRNLKLPTAKSRVQRARTRLRAELVERCGVRFDAQTGAVCCFTPEKTTCGERANCVTSA